MENRKLIGILVPGICLGLFLSTGNAAAYGVETHAFLTNEVFDFYNTHSSQKVSEELRSYLVDGARREDDMPRWMNHFFDPVYNRGLVSGYGGGYSSKSWALDPTKQNDLKYKTTAFLASILTAIQQQKINAISVETDFTWERGIRFYAAGEKEKAMFILGHILHLIEDASVPDHTRNDAHPGFGEDHSPYEDFAGQFVLANPDKELGVRLKDQRPILLSSLDAYFYGMANYSNNNFYSKDTIGIQSGYEKPEPANFELADDSYFGLAQDELGNNYRLVLKVANKGSMIISNQAVLSIDNPLIKKDYWSLLSTKSVQYGAGVIDLFLREAEAAKQDPDFLKTEKTFVGQIVEFAEGLLSKVTSSFAETANFPKTIEEVDLNKRPEPSKSVFENIGNEESSESAIAVAAPDLRRKPLESAAQTKIQEENISLAITSSSPLFAREPAAEVAESSAICKFAFTSNLLRADVVINEVAWMGGLNSSNDEWIELKNRGSEMADISSWRLIDQDEQIQFEFPVSTKIQPGKFYLLLRGEDGVEVGGRAYYSGSLRNEKEGLRLFDASCNLIDEVLANPAWPAGENAGRKTMERNAGDYGWHTSALPSGTPGAENSAPPPPPAPPPVAPSSVGGGSGVPPSPPPAPPVSIPVDTIAPSSSVNTSNKILISEIMVGASASGSQEFIELYNPNETRVDLSGWSLKRKATPSSNSENLVSKSSGNFSAKYIEPKSFLLIASNQYGGEANVRYSQNSVFMADNGDVILLYDSANVLIDEVSYGEIERGKSWERKASGCISAQSDYEFSGNGCDTDNFSDFELRESPDPQSSSGLTEPRAALSPPQNFTVSYNSSSRELVFNWSGNTSVIYNLYDQNASGTLLFNGAATSYAHLVSSTNPVRAFSLLALDSGGMSSLPVQAEINFSSPPELAGDIQLSFDGSQSLTVSWGGAEDADLPGDSLTYVLGLKEGEPDFVWTETDSLNFTKSVSTTSELEIALKAKDKFGNFSGTATTSWRYPVSQFPIEQLHEERWSRGWGGIDANCRPCWPYHDGGNQIADVSYQSVVPQSSFDFNTVIVKISRSSGWEDGSRHTLKVYAKNASSSYGFAEKIGEVTNAPLSSVFSFPSPISLSAGARYWFVLMPSGGGWYRYTSSNMISGQNSYAFGEAGVTLSKACADTDTGAVCEFIPPPENGLGEDWFMKIGTE